MINKFLDRLEEYIITFCLVVGTLLVFLSVIYRYTSGFDFVWYFTQHLNFTWAQEACIYLMIWLAKFGASYGVRTHAHVGVDIMVRKCTGAWQKFFALLSHGSGMFFTAIVAYLGARYIVFTYQTGQVSPDLYLPLWIVYSCVPVASSLMCYRFFQEFMKVYRVPVKDFSHE